MDDTGFPDSGDAVKIADPVRGKTFDGHITRVHSNSCISARADIDGKPFEYDTLFKCAPGAAKGWWFA